MLNSERPPLTGKRVQLMATCLCDAFHDDVAAATVQVLEHLGCTVDFPEAQTCCGQPAFNGGDWPASRKVLRHTVQTFAGSDPVIVPSGSCAAMLFHGAELEFEHEAGPARRGGARPADLGAGRLHRQRPQDLGLARPLRTAVAFHRSCHTRGTLTRRARRAPAQVDGRPAPGRIRRGRAVLRLRRAPFRSAFPHISARDGRPEARSRPRRQARRPGLGRHELPHAPGRPRRQGRGPDQDRPFRADPARCPRRTGGLLAA